MALVYPNANGNWSTVANWYSGGAPYGALPQPADTVCANGKTIALDMDFTVVSLTTAATAPAAAGGGFTCNVSRTITCNIVGGTTNCLTLTHTYGNTVTITGDSTGSSTYNGVAGIANISTGEVLLYGSAIGGNIAIGGATGLWNASTGSVTVYNAVGGSTTATSYGINNVTTAAITVSGIGGKAYNTSNVAPAIKNTTGTININCILKDHTGTAPFISSTGGTINIVATPCIIANAVITISGVVYATGTTTVNFTGDITGGTNVGAYAIVYDSTSAVYLTGNATGGTKEAAMYSPSSSNSLSDIAGDVIANGACAIVSLGYTSSNILRGSFTSNGNVTPFACTNVTISNTVSQVMYFRNLASDDISFSSNPAGGQASIDDVRNGVVYGSSNEFTGVAYIPSAASTLSGVPVDHTVGTAVMTMVDVETSMINALTTYTAVQVADLVGLGTQPGLAQEATVVKDDTIIINKLNEILSKLLSATTSSNQTVSNQGRNSYTPH